MVGSAVGVVICSLVSSDSPPVGHWNLMFICEVLFECLCCLSSLVSWMRDFVPFGTDRRANRLLVSYLMSLLDLRLVVVVNGCSLLLVLFSFTVFFCFSEAFILHSLWGHVDSVLGVCWMA